MSEIKGHIEIERGSDRNFGLVFAAVFFIIALIPLVDGGDIRVWALFVSGVFFCLAIFVPHILSLPNKLWFKLGIALGAIVAPIVMILVYLIAVVPSGLIVHLTSKDLLQQKQDKSAESYWIEREQSAGSMKDQF